MEVPVLTADQKAHFEVFGFLFMRGAFSSEEMEEITGAADEVWASDRDGRPTGETGQHMTRFVEQNQVLTRMVDDERVHGAVEDLLGTDFLWAGSEGNVTVRATHGWHADRPAERGSQLAFLRLKINVYLDPVTKDSGALRVIPGSHNPSFHLGLAPLQNTHHEMGQTDPTATPYGVSGPNLPCFPLESRPGDLVFFNQSLFHGVFSGFSGRRYIALKFAAYPTAGEHVDVLKATGGFEFQPHPAFEDSDLPRVRSMAGRLKAVAPRAHPNIDSIGKAI